MSRQSSTPELYYRGNLSAGPGRRRRRWTLIRRHSGRRSRLNADGRGAAAGCAMTDLTCKRHSWLVPGLDDEFLRRGV